MLCPAPPFQERPTIVQSLGRACKGRMMYLRKTEANNVTCGRQNLRRKTPRYPPGSEIAHCHVSVAILALAHSPYSRYQIQYSQRSCCDIRILNLHIRPGRREAPGQRLCLNPVYLVHKTGVTLRPLRHVHGAYIAGCLERFSFLYRSGHQREYDMKVKYAPLVR